MSDPNAGNYHFLSWMRQGIGAGINSSSGASQNRASVNVQLSVTRQDGTPYATQPSAVPVQLYGPGDVIGIDQRCIAATEPMPGTKTFEPNYLCGIEFSAPDLPWMLTPEAPGGSGVSSGKHCPAGDRLTPWIVLIALKQGGSEFSEPTHGSPLPTIQVLNLGALQDLSDSWNWAHVQVSGDAGLTATLNNDSKKVISRILCPRLLDPETAYSAFLVPAFETGRLAGLGKDSSSAGATDPAWPPKTTEPFYLPVYYQFDFQTSDQGDFESLVRRLQRLKKLPDGVGQRLMDVSMLGPNSPSAGGPLGLEGALANVGATSTPWNSPDKDAFRAQVQGWINQTAPITDDPSSPNPHDPVISPPIYARWPAAVGSVDRKASGWINELNLDPRTRSEASLGTAVVQHERAQLLKSAWEQVDGIIRANQAIQQAQLARAALQQLYTNKLGSASTDTFLQLTSPLHARVLVGKTTARSAVRSSRVPERVLSATYRRLTRPRRRLGPSSNRESLLRRINDRKASIVPKPKPPDGLVSIDQISEEREHSLERRLIEILAAIEAARRASRGITRRLFLLLLLGVAAVGLGVAIAGAHVLAELAELLGGKTPLRRMQVSSFTPKDVTSIPSRPHFTLSAPGTLPAPSGVQGGGDSSQAKAFRSATADLFAALQSHPVDPQPRPSLHLSSIQSSVINRIDPTVTVAQRAQGLISFPKSTLQPADILVSPILAAPEFSQPMYVPLRDLSPSYLLPGADKVPAESISLVVQNHKFIESYMAGINHEMTRQLIWEDYPIFNQRATYFRQFWDVSAYHAQNGDPSGPDLQELLKDIPPIQNWQLGTPLGQNLNRQDLAPDSVVLLVRGELFRRYPKTDVHVIKAKRNSDGTRVYDETDQRHPIFEGELPTDMTFRGFNLSVEEALGKTPSSPEGFFFVFQQPPSDPRFGLEPTSDSSTSSGKLGWLNFARRTSMDADKAASLKASAKQLARNSPWRYSSSLLSMVLKEAELPGFLSANQPPSVQNLSTGSATWGENSAQTACMLFRRPYRILIHADLLLSN